MPIFHKAICAENVTNKPLSDKRNCIRRFLLRFLEKNSFSEWRNIMTLFNSKITKFSYMFIFLTFITAAFLTNFSPLHFSIKKVQAAAPISFTKTYRDLTVGKKVKYQLKNMNKTNYAKFFLSNSSLASIEKNTGILTPKKTGILTVKAIVYNKKNKIIKILKNQVTIQEKKKILPNATFKVKKTINPWNFTITLSCSRILLEKEINTDKLSIYPKGKKSPKLTASFTKLSDNGQEIIYTLNTFSQAKLCPGNFSMDGTYILESKRFSKKLSLTYQERLTKNTLSGFVFYTNGNCVKNALVTLKKGDITIKKSYTDKNGHYLFKNISGSDCLTVEKSGFQKCTIQNPIISPKGTTCENIILRSEKDTDIAIEFFVTDKQDIPIPNTSIYLLEEKETKPNNHKTDSFSKDDILYSGTTDSTGKLLLSNTSSVPANPYSGLIFEEQTTLTYSSNQKPPVTNKNVLAKTILDCNKTYAIYIKNFSLEQPHSSYLTKKIIFSFSNILTNRALLHIKLEPCPLTSIKNLSIISDTPSSIYRSLSLQFFHPDRKESFYELTISKEQFRELGNQIVIPSLLLPTALPDGTYYLCIKALSEENNILSKSNFITCNITKHAISLKEVTLQKPQYARILAYGNFESRVSDIASFQLYQKVSNHYFFLQNVSTEQFTKKSHEFSLANLFLENLLPDTDYILIPSSSTIAAQEYVSFHTTKQTIFPTKVDAEHSLTPLSRIHCLKNFIPSIPPNFYLDTISISYQKSHNVTQDFVRRCQTYPNCVIAIYNSSGTLLTSTITTSPMLDYTSFPKYSIIDIYANNKILKTNQTSYQ